MNLKLYTILILCCHLLRAYTRMGNVYFKQEKWADAVKYYDKSLTEHRTQEVVNKKAQV